jgi:hypothetical protein
MALTQAQAQALIEQSMITGVPNSTFDAAGGYDAVYNLSKSTGWGAAAPSLASILQYGSNPNADGSGNQTYLSGTGAIAGGNTGNDGVAGNNYYDEAIKGMGLSASNAPLTLDQVDWGGWAAPSAPQVSAPAPYVPPPPPPAQAFRNSYGGGMNKVVDYRQPEMGTAYGDDQWLIWDTPTDTPGTINAGFTSGSDASNTGYATSAFNPGGVQNGTQAASALGYASPTSWDDRSQARSPITPWF